MNRISGSIFDELNNGYMQIYNQTCKKEIVDEGRVFGFSKISKIFESSDFSKKFKIFENFLELILTDKNRVKSLINISS